MSTRSRASAGLIAALVVLAAAVMVGLGVWQLARLHERRAANAVVAARLAQAPIDLNAQPGAVPPEYQPVRARGTFDAPQEIVLRNRAHLESPGVHLLTPLRLAGGEQAVLVDRGWIPYTEADPAARAPYRAPEGEAAVEGIVRASQARTLAFLPADPTLGPGQARLDAWFWVNIPQIQLQVPYPLLPFFIEAAAGPDPAQLPIAGYSVDLSEGPHLSYAIQWFSFATILVAGSMALARRRRKK
jgi:surfeit locus 1 family protein